MSDLTEHVAVAEVGRIGRLKNWYRRWEYPIGIFFVALTTALAVAVVYYWRLVLELSALGYVGAFLVSLLGGATIVVPVPMLAVVFALGGVLQPFWVGVVSGIGETLAALTIYLTGYGGGMALLKLKSDRIQSGYSRLMHLMERRGGVTLFFLSAVLNPFFYPAALAAGAIRFGIRRYFFICWVGKTIKGLTVAYAGYFGLRSLLRLLGMPF